MCLYYFKYGMTFMILLGCDYMSGKNVVKKDLVVAAEWFEKSAKKGFVHAALNVGKMYFEGTYAYLFIYHIFSRLHMNRINSYIILNYLV